MNFLPRTRAGFLWRALLASFLVIGFAAATTAVAGLLQVKTLANIIGQHSVSLNVTLPQPGKPETLLLVGSDHRAGTSYTTSNTDTMMLVRIDDSSSTINVMSIPRDLEVEGPGGGGVKLNSIYSTEHGDNGLLHALNTQIFPHLQINHVIDMNFVGFSELVDAIGCVYSQVDHRYYNVSSPPGTADNYSSIDIQPGYQPLCGHDLAVNGALPFVRFRHTDSDKVRNARQQDFIRWARDNYTASDLLNNEHKLLEIFGAHVETDKSLASTDGLIDLFNLIVNAQSSNLTLKTIPFPENFGPCGSGGETPCYVFACPTTATCTGSATNGPPLGESTEAEDVAYKEFITPTAAPAAKTTPSPTPSPTTKVVTTTHHVPVHHLSGGVSLAGLNPDVGDGESQAAQVGKVHFPVMFPKYIPASADYCFSLTANCDDGSEPQTAYTKSYPRGYILDGTDHKRYQAYAMTLLVNAALGEYFTIQGTTWRDPPILRNPDKIITVNGRKLYEFEDGPNLALVAFYTPTGVYWVANTLTNVIPNSEMVGMAATMIPGRA